MLSFGISDKGKKRDHNEDRIFFCDKQIGILPNLYIVADGVGGRVAGEIASSFAVEKFRNYVAETHLNTDPIELMVKGLEEINKYIYYKSENSYEFKGMATTFLAATVIENKVYCVNVGDSRLHMLGQKGIRQITEDNSYYNEMKNILEDIKINKNILSRAVGQMGSIKIDTYEINYDPTKADILMCTDGLNKMLDDQQILTIHNNSNNREDCVKELIREANENGGYDNISVIVIGN